MAAGGTSDAGEITEITPRHISYLEKIEYLYIFSPVVYAILQSAKSGHLKPVMTDKTKTVIDFMCLDDIREYMPDPELLYAHVAMITGDCRMYPLLKNLRIKNFFAKKIIKDGNLTVNEFLDRVYFSSNKNLEELRNILHIKDKKNETVMFAYLRQEQCNTQVIKMFFSDNDFTVDSIFFTNVFKKTVLEIITQEHWRTNSIRSRPEYFSDPLFPDPQRPEGMESRIRIVELCVEIFLEKAQEAIDKSSEDYGPRWKTLLNKTLFEMCFHRITNIKIMNLLIKKYGASLFYTGLPSSLHLKKNVFEMIYMRIWDVPGYFEIVLEQLENNYCDITPEFLNEIFMNIFLTYHNDLRWSTAKMIEKLVDVFIRRRLNFSSDYIRHILQNSEFNRQEKQIVIVEILGRTLPNTTKQPIVFEKPYDYEEVYSNTIYYKRLFDFLVIETRIPIRHELIDKLISRRYYSEEATMLLRSIVRHRPEHEYLTEILQPPPQAPVPIRRRTSLKIGNILFALAGIILVCGIKYDHFVVPELNEEWLKIF